MGFLDTAWTGIVSGLSYIWMLFVVWLSIFISPMHNLEILWIIIPIWVNFIFTEIFQEKKGTGLGNAVTNGAVLLWVGVDWVRYLIRMLSTGSLDFSIYVAGKFALCAFVLFIGFFIIVKGVKGNHYIRHVGRVRETTYLTLMFSPIIYGIIELTWTVFFAMVLFFPLFYYLVEYLDRVTPNPITYGPEPEKTSVTPDNPFLRR